MTPGPSDDARRSGWSIFRRAVSRVLRKRCPQCGTGELFAGRSKLRERCADCGLVYRREPGAMTGSMYLSAAITEVFAAGVIALVYLGTDWGAALSIAVGLPIVLAFCFWFLPVSKALWTAVEYATDAANREPWTRPR
jgi:uncharacterized protein (DUF983 family)